MLRGREETVWFQSLSSQPLYEEELKSLFIFCHNGRVICISKIIDIFPGNVDYSLCFIQPGISYDVLCIQASLIAELVKNLPAMQETPVQYLGWEDPLEKGQATHSSFVGFPLWLSSESACSEGDLSLILGLGRSPGEGKGYSLQYSGLKNSMRCIIHGVAKSRALLTFAFTQDV